MKKLIIGIACLLNITIFITPSVAIAATADNEVCAGLNEVSGSDCNAAAGATRINQLLRTVINIFSVVLGIIAVFMIIIAGVTIATSGGESSKISKARQSIITVAVGIAVIVFAQIIVHFVLKSA